MKTASKVFYTIGKVINIIEIVCAVLLLIAGILVMAKAPDVASKAAAEGITALDTVKKAQLAGTTIIVSAAIGLIVSILIFCFANHAAKALNNDKKENAPHIIMIIIGIFGDIFYLIGGIFGLIEENTNSGSAQ